MQEDVWKWDKNTQKSIFRKSSKPQSVGITGVAGELSWLERGIHKPEVGSSNLLPATNNISNLRILQFFEKAFNVPCFRGLVSEIITACGAHNPMFEGSNSLITIKIFSKREIFWNLQPEKPVR